MNTDMMSGVFRHFLTMVAAAVMAHGSTTLDTAIPTLMNNIATGDARAIVGASVVVFSVLWSMWVKATEETKQTIKTNAVKTLTLGMKG